jgi:ABC-type uncharacterized transport system substrate-binding protein
MDRRRFLLTSLAGALGVLVAPVLGGAQGTRKAPRVGVVLAATQALGQPSTEAFRAGLRDLGYLEGQSIAIEVRWAEGNPERFPDLIADLLRANVDVLVVVGANAALAAKKAATTTPVVFVAVTDPVGTGVVESLARPGGNITGVSMALGEGFAGKWVQHLKDALPRVSSVAALVEASHPLKTTWAREMGAASRAPEIKLQVLEVHPDVADLDRALSAVGKARPGALIVTPGPFLPQHRKKIADFVLGQRMPAIGGIREFAAAGLLMSYGPSIPDSWRRGAAYVDRILKGAKPADLPVEQATKFEFVLNLKTAKALGLTIPPSLLLRADQIIE